MCNIYNTVDSLNLKFENDKPNWSYQRSNYRKSTVVDNIYRIINYSNENKNIRS